MSDNLFKRAMALVDQNMSREVNCIPSPFPRLSMYYPGIEHGTYNIITASSGVGKSQFTDYLFLHHPVWYFYNNPDKLRVKIIYYSLEMNPTVKALQCIAHKIFMDTQQRVGIKQMMSTKRTLDEDVRNLMGSYEEYFDWFFQVVDMRPGPVVPYGIFKDVGAFFEANGTIHKKKAIDHKYDPNLGHDVEVERPQGVFDYYQPNDPSLFVILVVDHAALVQRQKGMDKRENMETLSEYLMTMRNQFGLITASIQQQSSSQEAKDNYRRPTLSGLGDNKAIQRDADNIFGLYDPMRHNDRIVNGWNMQHMNHRYRELILMKSRYGPSSITTDMFYDGTVEMFYEMPDAVTKFDDKEFARQNQANIEQWYAHARDLSIVL